MIKVKEDLTGRTFGKLTVLSQAEDYVSPKGQRKSQWICECSCEERNQIIVRGTDLKRNDKRATRSCGCIGKEKVIKTGHANAKPMCENPNLVLNLYDEVNNEFYGTCTTYNTGETYYFSMDFYDKIKDTCPKVYVDHNDRHRLSLYDKEKRRNVTLLTYVGLKGWDHIDRDNPLDNRKSNLRKATTSEQCQNRSVPKNNTSGIIGVQWNKDHQKWRAYIGVDHKKIYLGLFTDKNEAIKARLKAELKYFSNGFEPQRHLFAEYGII
jgi:hypothetical protein